eukprot:TRINITY_DN2186_c0_g1_i3.p1 TRINITY_DN2186_c0_g1~~TRINITY_DN2186_c0_g1_i3.p1  ORF type:complete len:508 (-),score=105.00 TRINITY_DN2186_c0_g1_i3:369-1865(-)
MDPIIALFCIQVLDSNYEGKNAYIRIKTSEKDIVSQTRKVRSLCPTWDEGSKILVKRSDIRVNLVFELCKGKNAQYEAVLRFDQFMEEYPSCTINEQVLVMNDMNGNLSDVELRITAEWKNQDDVNMWFWNGFLKNFDEDKSNTISKNELLDLLDALQCDLPQYTIDQIFELTDINEAEEFSFENFINIIQDDDGSGLKQIFDNNSLINENAIWNTAAFCDTDDVDVIILERLFGPKGKLNKMDKLDPSHQIYFQDRETGCIVKEKIPMYIKNSIRMLYNTRAGRFCFKGKGKKILQKLSEKQGRKYKSKKSIKDIRPFIKFHNINMDEALHEIDHFDCFNDFFIRKLRPGIRPIDPDPTVAVSPADCRLNVYQTLDQAKEIWIKGKEFTLHNLLENEVLEQEFENCSLVIARLAPQDYHRFHFPISGHVGEVVFQGNALYTVNPIGVRGFVDVFTENKRKTVIMENDVFGKVMYIAVGATMVGSIVLTSEENEFVNK